MQYCDHHRRKYKYQLSEEKKSRILIIIKKSSKEIISLRYCRVVRHYFLVVMPHPSFINNDFVAPARHTSNDANAKITFNMSSYSWHNILVRTIPIHFYYCCAQRATIVHCTYTQFSSRARAQLITLSYGLACVTRLCVIFFYLKARKWSIKCAYFLIIFYFVEWWVFGYLSCLSKIYLFKCAYTY